MSWKILMVDDNSTVLEVHQQLCSHMGYSVTAMESPVEALEYICRHGREIDMLITDFEMPELNGLELVQKVRRLYPVMPVLILTGFVSEVSQAMEDYRGLSVLTKPAKYDDLRTQIEQAKKAKAVCNEAGRHAGLKSMQFTSLSCAML